MAIRKSLSTNAVTVLQGKTASAGGMVETTEDTVVSATEISSSRAGVLFPMLILIAAAVTGNGNDDTPDERQASTRRIMTDVE